MQQYYLALEKHLATQSGYCRLMIIAELVMGIANANILFCHVISDQIRAKKISMIYYNERTDYDISKKDLQLIVVAQI